MSETALAALALAWADGDVDEQASDKVRAHVAAKNWADLKDPFEGALEFGTAGLRGVLGFGPNRMNRAVVIRTTAGLARYLKATPPSEGSTGVLYPGEVEYRNELARRKSGIEIEAATWDKLRALAAEYKVAAELGLD